MTICLVWGPEHVAKRAGKCRHCGLHTVLRDDDGRPSHKTCAEQALAAKTTAAVAAYQTSTIGAT
ncbi:hypothetical protein ABZ807_05590 [Micromonospora sp. NPDC047548]|uniref:hypothetical protein n=1 Tax=Micromonospora sp. NPDC047548 TaxID=3155624 RepID=UPI0033F2A2D8